MTDWANPASARWRAVTFDGDIGEAGADEQLPPPRCLVFDEDLRTRAVGLLATERMLRRAIDERRNPNSRS